MKNTRVTLTNKCIILDLDETLVHSNDSLELLNELGIYTDPQNYDLRERTYKVNMDDVVYKKGEGIKTEMWGIFRPHVKEFLADCFRYFKVVAIWSAGKRNYVNVILDRLFTDVGYRPHIIWTYDEIEIFQSSHNKILVKPISKMIEKIPGLNKYMSLENTFIVDDRSAVFQDINPANGIEIPAYKPNFTLKGLRGDDLALKQLSKWFMKPEVQNIKDVRDLDKKYIFE